MQGLEVLRLDFPSAVHLVDEQSGIEAHAQVSNPASAGRLEASDESPILRDVVVLRRPYWLRDLLERGLQDHTNRGFTRHFFWLIGDYAPVGRECKRDAAAWSRGPGRERRFSRAAGSGLAL